MRISEPLPVLPVRANASAACAVAAAAVGVARTADSTWRVCTPTSVASSAQATNRSVIASSASVLRRSTPVAATCAMTTAMEVSSVHSPGAQPNGPPPAMATGSPWIRAGANSYPAPRASPQARPSRTPAARSVCAGLSRAPVRRVVVMPPPAAGAGG